MSSLTIVGAGRVGLSLAADLAATKLFPTVTVVSPGPRPAFLSRYPEIGYARLADEGSASAGAEAVDPACLLFCVPDDVLSGAAAAWADRPSRSETPVEVALHTSGYHGAEVLAPLRREGAAVGSWHPLVAFAEPREGAFEGISVGLEGDEAAVALGEGLSRALRTRVIRVRSGEKARYHAAAVFASNYLVACLAVAARELEGASEGAPGPDHLLPLARSALEAITGVGLRSGLTGPLVRGDAATVAGHLRALDPGTASLYRALAKQLLDLVEERLDEPTRHALREAAGVESRQAARETRVR
ncbi:MAG: Rossmann-like and DUF2520 domain-containing protein [Gemmatimonadota bacterium]